MNANEYDQIINKRIKKGKKAGHYLRKKLLLNQMCGLAGYIGNKTVNIKKIREILKLMNNRGPDNQNFIKFSLLKKSLPFFHLD